MKRAAINLGIVYVILASFAGCKGEADVRTDFTIRAWEEIRPNEKYELMTCDVWVAYVDTAEWYVANYDDANKGPAGTPQMTSKKDANSKRDFDFKIIQESTITSDHPYRFEKSPLMILAFDRENPMFAYGGIDIPGGLPTLSVSITFKPWVNIYPRDTTYFQGKDYHWKIVNGDTKVPVNCTYNIQPRIQRMQENGDGTQSVKEEGKFENMVAYMLIDVDSAQWKVASAADARLGRLTHKETNATRDFMDNAADVKYDMSEANSEFMPDIVGTVRRIMFVLADNSQPMYAYGAADLAKNPLKPSAEKILFNPHLADITYYQFDNKRWTLVNENITPEPVDPVQP